MAHIITIPITPAEFEKAQIALDSKAGTSHVADEASGTVHSHDIDFNYTYDGATLTMDITARHTLKAKIADDDAIRDRVKEELLELA
jgi:hypothetical protein